MDRVNEYRQIICEFLKDLSQISPSYHLVFDEERDRYLVINDEWYDQKRIYGCVMHIELINGQIWVQQNNTEIYIEDELTQKGVERKDIIFGFRSPGFRQLIAAALEKAS